MSIVGSSVELNAVLSNETIPGGNYVRVFLYDIAEVPLTPAYQDLTYVDNGLYVGSFVMPDTVQVKAVYKVYTDAGYSIDHDYYGEAIETFDKSGNIPASIVSMGQSQMGSLPNMSDVLNGWLQPLTFIIITKSVVNFKIVEVETPKDFRGVVQPQASQTVNRKPEGQRAWKWYTVHTDFSLDIAPESIITYRDIKHRIVSKRDYRDYGFLEYEMVEDYTP